MFRSQGQESTALRQLPTSRTGRALVLETKHEADYTRARDGGQTGTFGALPPRFDPSQPGQVSSRRTNAAPVPSALSLARATPRPSGTIPQLVHGYTLSAGTYFSAPRIVAATSQ